MDVPEEDGVIFIKKSSNVEIGTFVNCKITEVRDYDLIAELISSTELS